MPRRTSTAQSIFRAHRKKLIVCALILGAALLWGLMGANGAGMAAVIIGALVRRERHAQRRAQARAEAAEYHAERLAESTEREADRARTQAREEARKWLDQDF